MSFVVTLDQPLYTGSAGSPLAPWPYAVSLGGHPYMVSTDPNANEKWGVRFQQISVPLLRDQTDTSTEPGEQSLSPNQLWRRSMESWHHGAGQLRYDRKTSDPYRFHTSKGVDCWTQGEITLLPDVSGLTYTGLTSGFPVTAIAAGNNLYVSTSTALHCYTTLTGGVPSGLTDITGLPSGEGVSLCTDGFNVWVAAGTNGLWQIPSDKTAAVSWTTGDAFWCGYAKGRLFAAGGGGTLYNITSSGTAITSQPLVANYGSRNWDWVACAEGPTCVYFAGNSGSQGAIFAVTIASDGTTLNAPTQAGVLPTGENITSMYSYLGYTMVGTTKGIRFANPDSSNNLTFGQLIPTGGAVYGFDGQDRFVWFTWTDYDANSSGLGRVDLSQFTDTLTPAYATDLMASTQGTCGSVTYWQGLHVFTTSSGTNGALWIENPNTRVTTGTITSGTIEYGLGDLKAAVFLQLAYDPLPAGASVQAELVSDQGGYANLGLRTSTGDTGGSNPFVVDQMVGAWFETTLTLVPSSSFQAPVLHRATLRAYPKTTRITEWAIPLLMHSPIVPDSAGWYSQDVEAEYAFLMGLYRSQQIVSFSIGKYSTLVAVTDLEWLPEQRTEDGITWNGAFVAHLREIAI